MFLLTLHFSVFFTYFSLDFYPFFLPVKAEMFHNNKKRNSLSLQAYKSLKTWILKILLWGLEFLTEYFE